jgi:hypothetical protein
VLIAHENEITADGRRLLAEVTHPNVAGLRSAITSGWDDARPLEAIRAAT